MLRASDGGSACAYFITRSHQRLTKKRKKKKTERKRGWVLGSGGQGVGGLGGGRQMSLSSLCMTAGKKKTRADLILLRDNSFEAIQNPERN